MGFLGDVVKLKHLCEANNPGFLLNMSCFDSNGGTPVRPAGLTADTQEVWKKVSNFLPS